MTAVVHPRVPPRRSTTRARTWWGKAWVRAVEEAAYAEADLRTARTLARAGRVGQVSVDAGTFVAAVEDARGLWTVSGTVPVLGAGQVAALVETVAAESGRVAALMAGDLPHGLVEHAEEAGVELLPYGGELGSACTCQAWLDPCPHALAVLYQLTWLLEGDPFVLLHLRGLARDELLAALHARDLGPTAASGEPGESGAAGMPGDRAVPGEQGVVGQRGDPGSGEDDVETGLDAALRAARLLDLLDSPPDPQHPEPPLDHLF